jgi:hypothetical protein
MQRELDGTRAQVCIRRRSIQIHPYVHSYMRTRTRARIGAAAAHNGRACVDNRPSAVRRGARRAESGAYLPHYRDSRGVPRADVRVEGPRRGERLRAENGTLGCGGKCSHASARMRARPRTHRSARPYACLGAYVAHVPYNTLARMLTDIRSLQACGAPPHTHTHKHKHTRTRTHTHTHTHTHKHTHTHIRAHDRGIDTDLCVHTAWKRSMHVCVGHR